MRHGQIVDGCTVEALVDVTGARVVIKNASGRTRGLEGLDDVSLVLRGDMPSAPIQVPMNGAIYMADLAGGRKQGYSLINVPIMPLRRAVQRRTCFGCLFARGWVFIGGTCGRGGSCCGG